MWQARTIVLKMSIYRYTFHPSERNSLFKYYQLGLICFLISHYHVVTLLQAIYFIYLFIGHMACGILVPAQGSNPCPLQ